MGNALPYMGTQRTPFFSNQEFGGTILGFGDNCRSLTRMTPWRDPKVSSSWVSETHCSKG
jgi:hypothetical protein